MHAIIRIIMLSILICPVPFIVKAYF